MKQFIVTVKYSRLPGHDPFNKVTARCPLSQNDTCTDVTGEHHSALWEGESIEAARQYFKDVTGLHITRIEEVRKYDC